MMISTGLSPVNTYSQQRFQSYPAPIGHQNPSLDQIKQALRGTILNASRIKPEPTSLIGIRHSQPIALDEPFVFPETGLPTVDHAVIKTGNVLSYLPSGIGNLIKSSLWGATAGGAFFAGLGGGTLGIVHVLKKAGCFQTKRPMSITTATLLSGMTGSIIGASVGFFKAALEGVRDLKNLIFET